MVLGMTSPHAANMSARPVNPDTDAPMPSSTTAQEQLADSALAMLLDELTGSRQLGSEQLAAVREALVHVATRQHGRTLRGCIAELRAETDRHEAEARRRLLDVRDDEPTDAAVLPAAEHAAAARTLRRTFLRGDR